MQLWKILVVAFAPLIYSINANASLIKNGDFSNGLDDWRVSYTSCVGLDPDKCERGPDSFSINNGWGNYKDHLKWNRDRDGDRAASISQNFYIPQSSPTIGPVSGIRVNFDFGGSFGESGNGNASDPNIDPASFFLSDVHILIGDNTSWNWSNTEYKALFKTNKTTGWTNVDVVYYIKGELSDLSPNARIRFNFNEKQDWFSNARLDNIIVEAVSAPTVITLFMLAVGIVLARRR